MSRSAIVRWFFGSLIGLTCGTILLFGAGALAVATDAFVMDGPDVAGVRATASAWTLVCLIGLAALVLIGSGAAMFVAWIGALLNTANLPDKTWFLVLLVVGLLGMVLFATVAYMAVGPDGPRAVRNADGNAPDQRSGREVPARDLDRQHIGV
jgi:hypothetical protein